ncbi:sigma-70 family RNA polymerase sigma factor [Microvirga sp. STR05]|uniref:Sigma-70 family RNA polymerase sigma factor n=2 Tax=Hymenobacter TaxID=89966 RepID=A0A7G7W6S0_9BACT|nr:MULTISPECIES: sigma-70 family RNA polymerase sigma factor [Hymenobacter]MBD2713690.1 sigma-70 family RNA polymerase sigma factor [Hymenobacter duratus]MBR7948592.1 sigma-70 family RNA polymerase sigma factor [Microvirga sp. STR05]QNH62063.1 sigma-70 family RNA polymerase sigma factor [Hymenobacter sediminicola]
MAKATASYTDDEFVAAIRRGDDRALAQLYRLHLPMVSHYVLQNSGTEDEAKDVYQEGIMVFYEKVRDGSLELSCQIKTYLYAVCRRLWLKRLTEKTRFGGRLDDHEPYLETGAEADLLEAEERDRRFATMGEALERLGEPCRSLLEGFYLLDKSMQQLTADFGYTNADNAKNQKYKCLVRLKKLFFTHYKEEESF